MIERGAPSERPESHKRERYIEYEGERFLVVEKNRLIPMDIELNDRAFFNTKSGTEYMLRHSSSHQGALMIYSTKHGELVGGRELYGAGTIAQIGAPAQFVIKDKVNSNLGREWTTTEVTQIEIVRKIDSAIKRNGKKAQSSLGQTLVDFIHGRKKL